ncbi:hypothetical protein TMatcc_009753 [Talaromyces marneffei ATCC 18224]|uniref:F-box domain protein n=2 Tax=Talaromyces marneffei TaxID=37727 RepID=B6QT66_TALMQ|nr:uncharacterized protein EYB26_008990 [Talaromyces marneffei]EEA19614.1 conserved hypothetical protein [Talaromyces marneffei ATCC 18224]KAE8547929.1 hypothetical protein EYB25_009722 [Talaromyces marneffei]QGA21280.1 hypothetical protein EYB26_008990 [Talaromyces marneffei]
MDESLLTAPSLNLRRNINLQHESPLFSMLPAEIRSLIFIYALTDYEDTAHEAFGRNTYWYRPDYQAKRRTETELLRSCKRVFQETWFLPFALAEHCFFLTHQGRAPRKHVTVKRMKEYLITLRDFARNQDGMDIPQIHNIRVFAQLWALEESRRLQEILDLDGFQPKHVTITLRYTDFWYWEDNRPIHIDSRWVNTVRFPASVSTISMDFEMIDRRKTEVDFITDLATQEWFFRRADGMVLRANKEDIIISRWTGSSTLGNSRWIRDESRPNEIDYYVKTVVWKPAPGFDPFVGAGRDRCPNLDIPNGFAREPSPHYRGFSRIPVNDLEANDIPHDATAQEVYEAMIRILRERQAAMMRSRRGSLGQNV